MLAKNVTAERARVDIQPRRLRIEILSQDGEKDYELDLDLAGEVHPRSMRHHRYQEVSRLCDNTEGAFLPVLFKWPCGRRC